MAAQMCWWRHLLCIYLWRFIIVVATVLLACGCDNSSTPTNVLLITIDTLRADHCSVLGYERDTTPRLSKLAKQGALFELAYAPTATTAPSHVSIFTGLYPLTHQIVRNGLILPNEFETMAEHFTHEGYQTAALVSSFVLHSKFNYGQGFQYYYDEMQGHEASAIGEWKAHDLKGGLDRRASFTSNRAIQWLQTQRDPKRPFFLFVHYFDPHHPYTPPKPFNTKYLSPANLANKKSLATHIAMYDGEIAFTDQQLGRLLDALDKFDLADNTLVVITSDHGEGLMQHGWLQHGIHIYEELVHVPLLIRWPKHVRAGLVLPEPVEVVDLPRTIFSLIGLKGDGPLFEGRNLAAALTGTGSLDPNRPIFLHRRRYPKMKLGQQWVQGEKFAIRSGRWKYILGEEEHTQELFDLAVDPLEKNNLFDEQSQLANQLADRLQNWREQYIGVGASDTPISEDDFIRLKALGYTNH